MMWMSVEDQSTREAGIAPIASASDCALKWAVMNLPRFRAEQGSLHRFIAERLHH